jgi:hypothetical protein
VRGTATDPLRPTYSLAAQITVPTVNDPNTTKVVELYGVYSDAFLVRNGCGVIPGGAYDRVTGVFYGPVDQNDPNSPIVDISPGSGEWLLIAAAA